MIKNPLTPSNEAPRFALRACAATVIAASSLVPSIVLAEPELNGNTITWSNTDWYQVQRADTYESVCEGRDPCSVEPGEYKILNLTSGERLQNITVQASVNSTVIVDGNVIRYPDNGWYQVQQATDFSSVCNGEASCTVEPGIYNVINHTLGQRFDGIEVVGGALPTDIEGTNNISVTDNLIEWPDNGWYQVLNANDYTEVCAGDSFCAVESGTYIVINHTTGDRYEDVKVGSPTRPDVPPQTDVPPQPDVPPLTGGSISLNGSAESILSSLAGYQLELVAVYAETLADGIIEGQEGFVLSNSFSNDGFGIEGSTEVRSADRTRYSCNGGGTIIVDNVSRSTSYDGRNEVEIDSGYEFFDCQYAAPEDFELPGTYTLNGTVVIERIQGTGEPYNNDLDVPVDPYKFGTLQIEFSSFRSEGPGGSELLADGRVSIRSGDDQWGDSTESRSGYIYDFSYSEGGIVMESINTSDFSISERTLDDIGSKSFSVDIDGDYTGANTYGSTVAVRTDPTLTRSNDFRFSDSEIIPFTGSVRFDSSDGSLLILNANPADQPTDAFNTLLFDSAFFPAEGEAESENDVQFQPLQVYVPICSASDDSDGDELACSFPF